MEESRNVVAVWGVFDLLHVGHFLFLQEASRYGDLHVILIPDHIACVNKGHRPLFSACEREQHLKALKIVKKVHHDCLEYGMKCLDDIRPAVFCTGYDQSETWETALQKMLVERRLVTKFVRLPSYADGISSSKIRDRLLEGRKLSNS